MDSRSGKQIRLGRLFDPASARSLIVAYSHGSFIGPLPGMESGAAMRLVANAMSRAEGLLVAPGVVSLLEDTLVRRDAPSLVVHLDWMNFTREVLLPDRLSVAPMAGVEESLRAGADAVMTFLYYGDPDLEAAQVRQVASIARECDLLGVPLIVEPRSSREKQRIADESDIDILIAFSRMSAELGADIVKCVWRGPVAGYAELARVVEATPAHVFLAGGMMRPEFREVLEATEGARDAGMTGLVYGRNVFQTASPGEAVDAVRDVFHRGTSIDEVIAEHPALAAGTHDASADSRY